MQKDHPSVVEVPQYGFEGPEKKLEIDFEFKSSSCSAKGLRNIPRDVLDKMLDLAKCSIVGNTSNEHFDSYVLSESSLFIYPTKLLIKTCGTTLLLRCCEMILDLAEELNMKPSFVCYSRKDLNFPDKQVFPHISFETEVEYLDQYFNGTPYVLGSTKGQHWYTYIADFNDHEFTKKNKPELTIEILMDGLSERKMKQFFKNESFVSGKETTKTSGIADLLPGSIIDEYQFDYKQQDFWLLFLLV